MNSTNEVAKKRTYMRNIMTKSGLIPEVLRNHDGADDLKMSDLSDIVIHQGRQSVSGCQTK